MGLSGAFRRAICAAALIAVPSITAAATTTFKLDDGFVNQDGHLEVPVDEYGSFGRLFPQSVYDWFQPALTTPDYPTYLAGVMLFLKTGADSSAVLLSEYSGWTNFIEGPPNPDGMVGTHTGLARTITQPISGSGNMATSAFQVTANGGIAIKVDLVQAITTDLTTATSLLDQKYTLQNTGTVSVDLVFHAAWEPDLYYDNGNTNGYANDVVGIGAGRCAVYTHNPNTTAVAVALASGPATTVGTPYLFGGKSGSVPGSGPEPFYAYSAGMSQQYVWNQRGMPVSWRNFVVGAGYTGAGDSGTLISDASMGMEWHFTLAPNETKVVDVARHYGTISIPCNVAPTCHNGQMDPGEACDGPADTATCNGSTCLASMCGDGVPNAAAGEACDTDGVDTNACNGQSCTLASCGDGHTNTAAGEECDDGGETAACTAACLPSSCGDGHVNAAAGEECEGGALCDVATCTVTFTVGGGCAGCSAPGTGSSLWLGGLAFAFSVRRRRRARRA